jgi:mRNA interferase MazF
MTDARLVQAGDICVVDLDPIRGSEQFGIRPVMVISSDLMHLKSKRIIICPITSNMDVWTTKIQLPEGAKTSGMVLTDQVRAVDRQERVLRYIETLPPEFVTLVRSYVGRLLELEVRQP